MTSGRIIRVAVGAAFILTSLVLVIAWTSFRVYVPPDRCLVLIRKTGEPLAPGEKIAGPGQMGIQGETLGPGRYFLNPWVWDWELHPLVEVSAGDPSGWREFYQDAASDTAFPQLDGAWPEVGVLVNRVGKPAPAGTEVVEVGYQGIQRAVLTPGTYRLNPYVFEVKRERAAVVPLGCVGVVTSQLGDLPDFETVEEASVGPDGQPVKGHPKKIQRLAKAGQRGVLENVLPPGIYYLNPYVHRVQIVQAGYNQISQRRDKDVNTTITFPSRDGFSIIVEVTVVWGRHPAHIAEMINRFGDIEKVKNIILAQMRSICRNVGSEFVSTDFISGEKREAYQREVTQTLQRACRERDIDILIALIHNIEVHGSAEAEREGMDLKTTIQRGYIAREQEITKQSQRESARVRATLETSKKNVEIAREQVTAETRKKVAETMAEAQKKAREIDAQRDLEVARIERQVADLEAETTRVLGRAEAQVEQLMNQADADGKRLFVEAFGGGRAYNLYTFSQEFKPESVRLIFAGPGTLWTDLNRLQEGAAADLLKHAGERGNAPD